MSFDTPPPRSKPRSALAAVALPTEHGGWGLTLEPALLGLLVAPSWPGLALAGSALIAFVAHAPLKIVLVDRYRHRRIPRTLLAEKVAALELGLLGALIGIAAVTARGSFWVPIVIAIPLVVLGLWFDMRSRSRRLLPELSGTVGIGGVVAAVVLADGGDQGLSAALWCIVGARAIASIPFVRVQLRRFKVQPYRHLESDAAQVLAIVVAAGAVALDARLLAGFVIVLVLSTLQLGALRRPPAAAAVLGAQQVVAGLTVVLVTALGVLAP